MRSLIEAKLLQRCVTGIATTERMLICLDSSPISSLSTETLDTVTVATTWISDGKYHDDTDSSTRYDLTNTVKLSAVK